MKKIANVLTVILLSGFSAYAKCPTQIKVASPSIQKPDAIKTEYKNAFDYMSKRASATTFKLVESGQNDTVSNNGDEKGLACGYESADVANSVGFANDESKHPLYIDIMQNGKITIYTPVQNTYVLKNVFEEKRFVAFTSVLPDLSLGTKTLSKTESAAMLVVLFTKCDESGCAPGVQVGTRFQHLNLQVTLK